MVADSVSSALRAFLPAGLSLIGCGEEEEELELFAFAEVLCKLFAEAAGEASDIAAAEVED